jgi:mRNA interferase MazF
MSPTTRGEPRRGEVWWVAFDPGTGGEIRKTRPALVVSNDAANRLLNRIQVVPLTSRTDRLYPGEAYVMLEGRRRKAMTDQITTASKLRLRGQIGRLDPADMTAVERAIRTQLAL